MSSNTPDPKSTMPVIENTKTTAKANPITMLNAAAKADSAIDKAKAMPGGNTDDGFLKNLFQTVQGVKHDALCPHGLPYYACMSCSH
jgi:hypothetical protein